MILIVTRKVWLLTSLSWDLLAAPKEIRWLSGQKWTGRVVTPSTWKLVLYEIFVTSAFGHNKKRIYPDEKGSAYLRHADRRPNYATHFVWVCDQH